MNDKKVGHTDEKKSMAMPDNYEDFKEIVDRKLKIDKNSYRPVKTRQQLYNELKQEEEFLDLDVYEYASYFDRGAALALDLIFIFILIKCIIGITCY